MQSAFGSGLGRYVGGLVPDVAFRSDGSISPIGTTSWVGGVEQKISPRLSLGGYYSGVNTDDNFDLDTDGSYIGFGYPGASNSNNRRIQEVTGTASYQFLKSPDRGSGQFNLQVSWLDEGALVARQRTGLGQRRHVLRPGSLQPAVNHADTNRRLGMNASNSQSSVRRCSTAIACRLSKMSVAYSRSIACSNPG